MSARQIMLEARRHLREGRLEEGHLGLLCAAGELLIEASKSSEPQVYAVGLAIKWLSEFISDDNLRSVGAKLELGHFQKEADGVYRLSSWSGYDMSTNAASAYGGPSFLSAIEPTEFSVKVLSAGPQRIMLIKILRELLNLSLQEAKTMSENLPLTVASYLPRYDAEDMKKKIDEIGAVCVIEASSSC